MGLRYAVAFRPCEPEIRMVLLQQLTAVLDRRIARTARKSTFVAEIVRLGISSYVSCLTLT